MRYIAEISIENFNFWCGAKDRANRINERSDSEEIWQLIENFIEEEEV